MDDPVWEIMNENRMVSVPKGCILLKMEKDDWELSVFRSFNAVVVGLPSKFQIDLQCLDTQGLTWKVHNNNTLCIVPTEGRKKPDIVKVKRIKSDNFELFDVLQITFRDDMMKVTFSCEFIYKIHGCIQYIEVIRKDNDYELSIKDAQCNANDNDTGAPVIVNGMSGNGIRIENMFYVNEMNISNSGTLNIRETRVSEVDATVRPPNIVEEGRSDRPEFQRFPSVSPEYAAIEPVGSSNNLEGNEITRPQTSNADLVQNYEEASASFQLSNPSLILNRIPNKVHFMKSWLAESNENQDVGNEDSVENSDSANELVDEAGDTPSPPKTPDPYAEDMEEQGEQSLSAFQCDVCAKEYKTNYSLKRHRMNKHKTKFEYSVPKSNITIFCECGAKYTHPSSLSRHKKECKKAIKARKKRKDKKKKSRQ